MAVTQMKMTPAEAWMAVTANAAAAVGRNSRIGRIQPGYRADLALFEGGDYRHIPYHYGHEHVRLVVIRGKVAHEAGQTLRCS
jgi:imidazolonepropionase